MQNTKSFEYIFEVACEVFCFGLFFNIRLIVSRVEENKIKAVQSQVLSLSCWR